MTLADTISGKISKFVVSMSFDDLPDDVISFAKLLLLDLLGAALAGVNTEEGLAVKKVLTSVGSGGRASIWRSDVSTTPIHAAFANGTIAHAQELDDFNGCDHSGAVVIPAIIAIAEAEKIYDGKRFLEAMILGYEFGVRALDVFGGYRAHNNAGWHSTGTCGSIGSAVASAKMLGLNQEQTRDAVGLAGNMMAGTWSFLADGSMAKRTNAGKAAENGVLSAYLARSGFSGPSQVFEAKWGGLFNTYTSTPVYPEYFFEGLGHAFGLMRSGIKPHASCRGAHSATDSALKLRQKIKNYESIAKIRLRCSKANFRTLGNIDPKTRLAAQMSLPYCIATSFVFGSCSLDDFEEPKFSDPTLRRFLKCITIVEDEALIGETPAIVEVTLNSGEQLSDQTLIALGDPKNQMSEVQIEEKFLQLATRSLNNGLAAKLRDAVYGLDSIGSIPNILEILK
ncbi:MAG: 2-methylcitrate dehydratase [Magnetovibrio sp.]|nr:2-methylcitrate dehydratase [Magnetovibrio sp.]|tara:strand:- start:1007 stop:2365 length:1359 start_codon:yes stop_codon:yes gene_type:complete